MKRGVARRRSSCSGSGRVAAEADLLDDDVDPRAVALAPVDAGDLGDDVLPGDEPPEYGVPLVEPRRRLLGDEELRAVRVRPRVRHREDAGSVVAELGVDLVVELVAGAAGAL